MKIFKALLKEDTEQITIINHNGMSSITFDLIDNDCLAINKDCIDCGKNSNMKVVGIFRNGDYIEPDMECGYCKEINWIKKMV